MRVRKRPVEVEAHLFEWGMEDGVKRYNQIIPKEGDNYPESMRSNDYPGYLGKYEVELEHRGFEQGQWQPYIQTLEGEMLISEGDYIITGVQGERYPIKPEIFEKTYEII